MESCCVLDVEDPFQDAIDKFKRIGKVQMPDQKLSIIEETTNIITTCLRTRYFKKVVVDADCLLLVWLYILHRARVKNLHANLRFVEEFTSEEELYQSRRGHSFVTLYTTLECLTKLNNAEEYYSGSKAKSIISSE